MEWTSRERNEPQWTPIESHWMFVVRDPMQREVHSERTDVERRERGEHFLERNPSRRRWSNERQHSRWIDGRLPYRWKYLSLQTIIHSFAWVRQGINAWSAAPLLINRCLRTKTLDCHYRTSPSWSSSTLPWTNLEKTWLDLFVRPIFFRSISSAKTITSEPMSNGLSRSSFSCSKHWCLRRTTPADLLAELVESIPRAPELFDDEQFVLPLFAFPSANRTLLESTDGQRRKSDNSISFKGTCSFMMMMMVVVVVMWLFDRYERTNRSNDRSWRSRSGVNTSLMWTQISLVW